jgi:hypothetical protein
VTVRSTSLRVRAFALLTLAACLVALSITATPARAGLGISCPDPASQVFKPWGDYANYAFAPNGGFESGTYGWTTSGGAKVVAGNESFFVHGAGERYALSLPSGSSVTSPPMCVSLLNGKMRFFTANAGSSSSRLRVQVIYNGGVGGLLGLVGQVLGIADVGYVSSGSAWQPSAPVGMLGGTLPLLTKSVQFRFRPADSNGSWRIDDVYLDPLLHR